jgi:hypothetical protein
MANNTLLAETLTELETLLQNIRDLKSWKEGLSFLDNGANSANGPAKLDSNALVPTALLPLVAKGVHVYNGEVSLPTSASSGGTIAEGGMVVFNNATMHFVYAVSVNGGVPTYYGTWPGATTYGTATNIGAEPIVGALYANAATTPAKLWTYYNGTKLLLT